MDYFNVDYDYLNDYLSEITRLYNNRVHNEEDIQVKFDEFIKDMIFRIL